ncbi:tRNA (N6-threonylcarbamoyladenosine(37)-N6)-methyltransferase TrmO [Streptomyces sp. CBMA152]|uniref:tRNA (N6-threonylcarbamoyladenosine(37)-N6)-methyltransferase TrmO n=1 Tax=Streptomyces sp. CBMA152 TaxID=1896312 RepID=UPI0016613A03|nr:tRNA (N6-threonylcarbamoyladenosine(37)-N6)-methyltransferase TrmO [Streptomyces sp. CBMA152]MBD0747965.1 tRNA (N6-threonylcarbamoyladenosine(37)-N6)-methyltransferase TrmO [Streptomyces sp. CBMA152]
MSQQPARPTADAVVPMTPIGYVVTEYAKPQQAPPQATLAYEDQGRVVLFEPYAPGLDGLAPGWYVWLLTWLHDQTEEETTPLRVVPRGWEKSGRTTGVYATRTPNRHNRIGLSLVRIRDVKENVLYFDGVDLVDGTPVLDIKPYSTTSDTPPEDD